MRKLTAVALAVAFASTFISVVLAQEVELTTKFREKYIGTTASVFHDGAVQQSYLDFFWKNGFWAEVWTSTGFDTENNWGKEIDLVVGKNGRLGRFSYGTDFEYFFIQGKDVVNLNGEISRTFADGTLIPFLRAEAYAPNQKGGMRKGLMGILGVKSELKITPRISTSISTQIRKDSGCFGFDSGVLGQGYFRVKVTLSEKWSVIPGIVGFIPLSHRQDGRVAATASEIALTRHF